MLNAIILGTLVIAALGAFAILGRRLSKPKKELVFVPPVDFRIDRINRRLCPNCQASNSLCAGPTGGMAMNVACDQCHHEFNIMHGFGTGVFHVDDHGVISAERLRNGYGIEPNEDNTHGGN